jgi:hypothetical protein
VLWSPPLCGYGAGLSNVKILITLSYGEGSVGSEEFMAEDLGEEDIVGDIFGFELVAAEGAVGAAQVAGFPREVEGAEGGGNVLGELWAGGGVNGCGGRKALEVPESVEGLDKFLWVAEDGDGIWLEAGAGCLAGFELAVKEEGGIRELFPREAEGGAKEDLGRPAPGQGHEAHAFLEVAVASEEFESGLDEGLRIEGDEVGLVTVDALVVGGVERAGFFWIERQIAEALTGTHFPWAQDQVIGVHGADRVAVLGEGELDGGKGVTGFEGTDFDPHWLVLNRPPTTFGPVTFNSRAARPRKP